MRALGLWWGTVEGADLEELARAACAAGCEQISVSPPMYFAARAGGRSDAELRHVLADCGVAVAMIDPLIRGLPGSPLPEQVPRRFRPTFEHGEDDCARAAEALSARALNAAHYLGAPVPRDDLADAFGGLAARAAARGLEVWIEFMPDGGIPDLASASALLQAIGTRNAGLTLDTWHLFRTGESLAALRSLPRQAIRALQVADARADLKGTKTQPPTADRLLPGRGDIPLREILALVLADHAGAAIGVEVFDRSALGRPAAQRARDALAALRSLLPQAPRRSESGDL
jgi:sugar phosphate isomerase/epimerase